MLRTNAQWVAVRWEWLRLRTRDFLHVARGRYKSWRDRNKITAEEADQLFPADGRCAHCGGWHPHACPRIKSIEFTGENPTKVEFWKHDEWPRDQVLFPWQKAKMILEGKELSADAG